MASNIYDQQIDDFICRARGRLGELALGQARTCAAGCPCGGSPHHSPRAACGCDRELLGDLALALDTLADCHSPLSVAQKLRMVGILTARADLRCATPVDAACGVIVRQGAACGCSASSPGALNLPLTGEQVTVRVGGHTRQLQSVITEIYNRTAALYLVDGGIPSSIYHPSTQRTL